MSKAEQTEALQQVAELRRTIEERDSALANVESLRAEYLKYKEAANANSDNAAALREQLRQMTVERDAARAKVAIVIAERDAAELERTESRAEVVQLRVERDAARKFADDSQVELGQWQVGYDAVKEQLARFKEGADMFEQENTAL